MKIMKVSIALIAILSLVLVSFTPLTDFSKGDSFTTSSGDIDHNLLQQKWLLSHYELLGDKIPLETAEKGDYIHFLANNTYTSISEGKLEKGKYTLNKSTIEMTSESEEGVLKLVIKKLTAKALVVFIDDPNDSDSKYFTLHFKR